MTRSKYRHGVTPAFPDTFNCGDRATWASVSNLGAKLAAELDDKLKARFESVLDVVRALTKSGANVSITHDANGDIQLIATVPLVTFREAAR